MVYTEGGEVVGRQTTSKAERRLIERLDALVGERDRDSNPARFQINREGVRSSISDISYREYRVAVYYDGCYWHECPAHFPLSRGGGVNHKDAVVSESVIAQGWTLFRIWEHDDEELKVAEVAAFIQRRREELVRARVAHVASHEARAWCYDCEEWPHEPWPIDPDNDVCMRCMQYTVEHEAVPDSWTPVLKRAVVMCRQQHLEDPLDMLGREQLVDLAHRTTAALAARVA